ncbi:MAG: M3 family oligoendopeptidase [Spirochaetaceae bacterium]|jgi:pepF/M3 family oligoendopeptidase|nr:M3 family oligoendopeptidase [Spirochaetaceae bacterium]
MTETGHAAPRWQLTAVYPSFDDPAYTQDRDLLETRLAGILEALASPLPESAPELLALIKSLERAGDLEENLSAYAETTYTADTRSARAVKEINALEAAALPLEKAGVRFRRRLREQWGRIEPLAEASPELAPYRFFLARSAAKAAFQMPPDLEDIAADLARSGASAWSRLHDALTASAAGVFDPATGEKKTLTALRELANHPDRSVRERSYYGEIGALKDAAIPLAAALNGVKGAAITVDRRRGWAGPDGSCDPLRKAAFQSRITEKTLQSLIAALEESLPLFRQYLHAKARRLNLPGCAFYDLFAPLGQSRVWTWGEAAEFIPRQFEGFDPGMAAFARHAFALSWIDGEIRDGKVGGAYCASFPLTGTSRILCNFNGSFDSVVTLAHELGHAWHHEVVKDLPRFLTSYPMTLAETASIFAETLVFEKSLEDAAPSERIGLLEGKLKDSCQVVVDILSRFYFERGLFKQRERGELGVEELCALMEDAQKKTYGDGLTLYHPYMWAVKSHYYRADLGFYNYPYALGLLFSLGLYALARESGPGFCAVYRDLLRLSGRAPVEEVIRAAGLTVENGELWRKGIAVIAEHAAEFDSVQAQSRKPL